MGGRKVGSSAVVGLGLTCSPLEASGARKEGASEPQARLSLPRCRKTARGVVRCDSWSPHTELFGESFSLLLAAGLFVRVYVLNIVINAK